MKKFNVFLFVHWNADYSDPATVKWITVFAKSKDEVKQPEKYRGWYVSKQTVHEIGVPS